MFSSGLYFLPNSRRGKSVWAFVKQYLFLKLWPGFALSFMNHLSEFRILLYLLVVIPTFLFAQERVKLIPEGAAEPEHLKNRYEGNSRQLNSFRPANIRPSSPDELDAAARQRKEMQATSILKN